MAEQAGLCNICTEYGSQNSQNLTNFLNDLAETFMDPRKSEHLQRRLSPLKGYLLSDFSNNLEAHDTCPFHCMTLMLSENPSCATPEEHRKSCDMCIEQFQSFDDLKNEMDNCESIDDKERQMKKIEQYQQNLQTYIFHLVRGKYQ